MRRPRLINRGAAEPALPPGVNPGDMDGLRVQVGWLQSRAVAQLDDIREADFRVFSQNGEDGVIQFLAQRVPLAETSFVEIGVENYVESNTRFLLVKDNWRGLIIDADGEHQRYLEATGLAWRHDIQAVTAFVDRENVCDLVTGAGYEGDIGLLSIDIDGNDYWVLESLLQVVKPRILVAEYNSTFGPEAEITVPYDAKYDRFRGHHSGLYFGASLGGLARLADSHGYGLVHCGDTGVNAFFVRRDVIGPLRELSAAEGYVRCRVRDTRDSAGSLSYVASHSERLSMIGQLPVIEVGTGESSTVASAVAPMPDE